jgi:cyclase
MVSSVRVIARLDIKGERLIKTVQLEGLRNLGDPRVAAIEYYEQGADELVILDIVASLYGREKVIQIIDEITRRVFIPITVGGGIRTVEDARELLRAGADKIAINSAALIRPSLIRELSEEFGSQAVVVSVEARKNRSGVFEAWIHTGRDESGRSVTDWLAEAVGLGAGEVLVTSIDREGTRRGFDLELIQVASRSVSVPVIASGGLGSEVHAVELCKATSASAFAVADALHFKRLKISTLKGALVSEGFQLRRDGMNFEGFDH